jgi:hypothetical protein
MPVLDDQGQNRANIDGRQVYTFRINFTLADKQNTLKVTPTPVPTQDGRMGAPGFRPNQPLRRN